jgi:dTDP-4-amino-4,6-dideoxygalactose transaminase
MTILRIAAGSSPLIIVKNYAKNICNKENIVYQRVGFDNLLIGREEAEIAKKGLEMGDEGLVSGDGTESYAEAIAQYLDIKRKQIYSFYTAHGGLCFLLKQLRKYYPERYKVILPAFTCTVVVNAVVAAGLKPVFVDIELESFDLDFVRLQTAVANTEGLLAVMHQYLFGQVPRNVLQIVELCKKSKLFLIGDCAQALGARANGKSLGLIEDFSIFSSQASKNINTYTGGFFVNNREDFDFSEEYHKVPDVDSSSLRKILLAYYVQYNRKTVNSWILPFYNYTSRAKLISSMHPREKDSYSDTEFYTDQTKFLCTSKFPAILGQIGTIQLKKLETNILIWEANREIIEEVFCFRTAINQNARATFLRVPFLSSEEFKKGKTFDKDIMIGKWFPYSFGGFPNATLASKRLVNFSRITPYVS